MKKHRIGAIKLFFLFATLGAFPFLYPAMQFQLQNLAVNHNHSFDVRSTDRLVSFPASEVLVPIDPTLGSEVKPDLVE